MQVNHEVIDAYLNGGQIDDLPNAKDIEAETKAKTTQIAAIRQTLAVLADNAKVQAELDEVEAVLVAATHIPEPVVEPSQSSSRVLLPVIGLVAVCSAIVLVVGLL